MSYPVLLTHPERARRMEYRRQLAPVLQCPGRPTRKKRGRDGLGHCGGESGPEQGMSSPPPKLEDWHI